MTTVLHLFLDSNILINHLCDADKYLCTSQLLEKIGRKQYSAYISDFVYSESLGEMKCKYESAKHLSYKHEDAVPKDVRERMVQAIEEFKKGYNLNSVQIPLDQLQVYQYVRDYCLQAKDAPIVLSAQYLMRKLKTDVYLVTSDMQSLFYKASKILKTLHPSFHLEYCPKECMLYSTCQWKNRFTSPHIKNLV